MVPRVSALNETSNKMKKSNCIILLVVIAIMVGIAIEVYLSKQEEKEKSVNEGSRKSKQARPYQR